VRLSGRVEKSEREAGCEPGPCSLCERRAAQPATPTPAGFVEELLQVVEFPCPRCGKSISFRVVYLDRKAAA
jgi:predicted RNA-binding Zn-ribbon protein involved in translation (DUF1610 family)